MLHYGNSIITKVILFGGKYYGVTSPSSGYIKTTNTDNIVLYVTQSLPNVVIYKHDEDSVDVRNKAGVVSFKKYDSDSSTFHSVLYKPSMHTMKDLTEGSHSLTILIKEKYIIDEKGERH